MTSDDRADMIERLNERARAQFLAACCERIVELYSELASAYDRKVDAVVDSAWAMAVGMPTSVTAQTAEALGMSATDSFDASLALGHAVEAFAQAAEYLTALAPDSVRLSANNALSAIEFALPDDALESGEYAWQEKLLSRLLAGPMTRDEIRSELLADEPQWLQVIRYQ